MYNMSLPYKEICLSFEWSWNFQERLVRKYQLWEDAYEVVQMLSTAGNKLGWSSRVAGNYGERENLDLVI